MNIEDKSLKKELIYFKEDILKDLRLEMSKLINKIEIQKESFNHTILTLETKMGNITEKLTTLSNSIHEDITIKEKISKLIQFQTKTQDTLSYHDSKLKEQSRLIIETMNKIDNVINESILYNDIIGPKPNCKFKNFHSFIDYIILNITQLNNFKEKSNSTDFKTFFKSKIDIIQESLRVQIMNSSKSNNNYAKNLIEKEKENIEELFKTYNEKIFDLKIENIKYIDDMKISFENMQKEWEKIILIRNEISEKIEKEKEVTKRANELIQSKLEEYQIIYSEQNNKINKSIEEIYNMIKALKISQNKNNIEIKENKILERKEEKNFERKEEIKEEKKVERREENQFENKEEKINEKKEEKRKEIKKEYEKEIKQIKEKKGETINKFEEIKENKMDEKEEKKNEKREEAESLLKQYIEGKINYEEISNHKINKRNKFSDDRNTHYKKLNHIEENSKKIKIKNKNEKSNYFEIFNTFINNNHKIKSIYNTNEKTTQNFIDRIIIRSAINSQINNNENLNRIILNNFKNQEQLKISEKEKNQNQNLNINENLNLDEHPLTLSQENINSPKNNDLNDQILNSIKESILINYNNKNHLYRNNLEINNRRTSISLIKKKNHNINSQLSFLNNHLGEKPKNLSPSFSLQNISSTKKFNINNTLKRNSSLDLGKNFTSINNKIENIQKKSIFNKMTKDENNINIINYSNKGGSQRLLQNKNKFRIDASISNYFEKNYENLKYKKNILIKNDANNIKNNFESRNFSNKASNKASTFYNSVSNSRYTKNNL